jgi:hypothetical protein
MDNIVEDNPLDPHSDRVREHTAAAVNRCIDAMTRTAVEENIRHGRDAIVRRLAELDREWDVDRVLMVNFAVLGGASFLAGMRRYAGTPPFARRRKGFLYLFGAQLAFLFLHGTAGWCPPVSLFRRLGIRTMREIEAERRVLQSALEKT